MQLRRHGNPGDGCAMQRGFSGNSYEKQVARRSQNAGLVGTVRLIAEVRH